MNSPLTIFKKHRLIVSFLFIIILFLSFGIFTVNGFFALGNLTKSIYEHPLVVSNASLNAALNIANIHSNMKDVVLSDADNERINALKAVNKNEKELYRQLDTIRDEILGEEGKALQRETRQLIIEWKPRREKIIRLLDSGKKQEAYQFTRSKGADHVAKLESKMLELSSYARNKATGFMGYAEVSYSKFETIAIALTAIGVFLSLAIALTTTFSSIKAEKILHDKKNKLQKALDEIKILQGIIPICSHCKQIRDDDGIWNQIEKYINEHSEASFSHGICPDCLETHHPEQYASIQLKEKQKE